MVSTHICIHRTRRRTNDVGTVHHTTADDDDFDRRHEPAPRIDGPYIEALIANRPRYVVSTRGRVKSSLKPTCNNFERLLSEHPETSRMIPGKAHPDASASAHPMPPPGQGRALKSTGMCPPRQPACAGFPRSRLPSIMVTPPISVPSVIINTSLKPRAAPAYDSPNSANRASFSIRSGRPRVSRPQAEESTSGASSYVLLVETTLPIRESTKPGKPTAMR
jgi:hypothetical protein